ncbi:hypothetical protein BSKO_10220 [Bryopsis sp. KO-2023]|nr:hypothetical protein BSKO_10220 [Bryopsis sp. KO-2023]
MHHLTTAPPRSFRSWLSKPRLAMWGDLKWRFEMGASGDISNIVEPGSLVGSRSRMGVEAFVVECIPIWDWEFDGEAKEELASVERKTIIELQLRNCMHACIVKEPQDFRVLGNHRE